MFTPQRKGWPVTPYRNSGTSVFSSPRSKDVHNSKGKGVASFEGQPPPIASLGDSGRNTDDTDEREVWQKFREVGLLDEESMDRKDRQAMLMKVSKLENELLEYQYNMGLLLIEKNEWTSKFEELSQSLSEAQELLKREKVAHSAAVSDLERRGENLRNTFGLEKQCVVDLENALREMHAESAEIKNTSKAKMDEAEALVASIEEKGLEVEAKLHAANAKFAEASRKSSEMERKLKEVEARESLLRSERQSLNTESGLLEMDSSKQREQLREWERTLKEREDRLVENQRIFNLREERANENDRTSELRKKQLEEAHKEIEKNTLDLKNKEDDVNIRVENLAEKEREYNATKKNLKTREKELQTLQEELGRRENGEIQKIVDEHNAILKAKRCEFDLEIDYKRKTFAEELKEKASAVERKEVEINHEKEKINKQEHALKKKLEKYKEKDINLQAKLKVLTEKENSLKSEEKNLELGKKQMTIDEEQLQFLLTEIEKKKEEVEEEQLKLQQEAENLKLIEEERNEHIRLKSELKQEIIKCKHQEVLLLNEHESLKQEKENFEREWDILDEKRTEIEKELIKISEEKNKFNKLKHLEEEKQKQEKFSTDNYIKREMEEIALQKESFEALMKHEQSLITETAQRENEAMVRNFELQKRELEVDMHNKREEMEKQLNEKEKAFLEQREKEINDINHLKEAAERELEDINLERAIIEKDKHNVNEDKQHLERQQIDMRGDIENLDNLIKKLKSQREQFKIFVENHNSCKSCGEIIADFILSDLHSFEEMNNTEAPIQKRTDNYLEKLDSSRMYSHALPQTGLGTNVLRKCKNAFKLISPVSKKTVQFSLPVNKDSTEGAPDFSNDFEPSLRTANAQGIQSDTSIRDFVGEPAQYFDENSNIDSNVEEVPEDSQSSEPKNRCQGKTSAKGMRNAVIRRTHTMKEVLAEGKAFLEASPELNKVEEPNENIIRETSKGSTETATKGATYSRRKRQLDTEYRPTASEQDTDESEAHSDSTTTGGRKKRRQADTHVENPYNLRQRKNAGNVQRALATPDPKKKVMKKDTNCAVKVTRGDGQLSKLNANVVPSQEVATNKEQYQERSLDRVDSFEAVAMVDHRNQGIRNLLNTMELREEVIVTTEVDRENMTNEKEYETDDGDNVEDEDYGDDDEEEQPGEASIGKKVWTFFTT